MVMDKKKGASGLTTLQRNSYLLILLPQLERYGTVGCHGEQPRLESGRKKQSPLHLKKENGKEGGIFPVALAGGWLDPTLSQPSGDDISTLSHSVPRVNNVACAETSRR